MRSKRRIKLHIIWILPFCLLLSSESFAFGAKNAKSNTGKLFITVGDQTFFEKSIFAYDSLRLTEQKVEEWIVIRIEVAKLQNKMKANASEFDNVVADFYKERKGLLASSGWTVQEFDQVKERIHAAVSAMDISEDLQASKADHQKEIKEIKANTFYTDQQKEELINAMNEMRNQQREQFVEPTKKDWPAVRPYKDILEEMTDWIAGNIPNPPKL